jgi:hypothetical protein
MAALKTQANQQSVTAFIASITDEKKREDSYAICEMMEHICNAKPKMWGNAIIGFGETPYTYADGRTINWFVMGFSPRKQNIALYVNGALMHPALPQLGKYKNGKHCLYIKSLNDVDQAVLKQLLSDCNKILEQ